VVEALHDDALDSGVEVPCEPCVGGLVEQLQE
jgi:hypothetical protein